MKDGWAWLNVGLAALLLGVVGTLDRRDREATDEGLEPRPAGPPDPFESSAQESPDGPGAEVVAPAPRHPALERADAAEAAGDLLTAERCLAAARAGRVGPPGRD